jgi:hypothetical protein
MDSLRPQALDDARSSFDEDELDAIYIKCQAMIDHLDGSDGKHKSPHGDSDDSMDYFVDEHAQTIPHQSAPPVSSLHQESPAPSIHHIISKPLPFFFLAAHHPVCIVCSMARPSVWAMAYQNLHTLTHETWIDATVLNIHLLSQWYAVQGMTHVRYVDLFSAIPSVPSNFYALPEAGEINLFRQRHLFDTLPADSSVPVAFVVMCNSHFFVAVFEYESHSAFVFGRRISGVPEIPHPTYSNPHDDWKGWNGPRYWKHIAALHGYDAMDPDQVTVHAWNWIQNGMDCGPIASFVMESLMNSGLYGGQGHTVHIPSIPCGHRLRLRMFAMVKEACRRSWEDYCYLSSTAHPPGNIWSEWDDTMGVSEESIAEVQNQAFGEVHASIIRELNVVSANCHVCQRMRSRSRAPSLPPSDDDLQRDDDVEEDQPPLDAKAQHLRNLLRRYPYVNRARARDHLPPRAVHGINVQEDFNRRQRKHVEPGQSMFRFPRPTPALHLPAYQGRRWKPFDRTYDEYEGGPILESLHQDRNPHEFVEEPYYRPGIWTLFRDYGYRLLSSFSQMFYLDRPVKLADHILPVGIPENYESSNQIDDHVTGE